MRRALVTVALSTVLLGAAAITGTGPAMAEPHQTRAFGSCSEVNAEYAGGVARTQKAADRVVRQGFQRPIVCPTAYGANRGFDRDRDGVICERRSR